MPSPKVTAKTSPTGLRGRLDDATKERYVRIEFDDEESQSRTLFAVNVIGPPLVSATAHGPEEPEAGYIFDFRPGRISSRVATTGTYGGGRSNLTEHFRLRLLTHSHGWLLGRAQSFVQEPRVTWFVDDPSVNFREVPQESNESNVSVLADDEFLGRAPIHVEGRFQHRDPRQAFVRLAQVNLKLAEELADLGTLEPGWDGYAADPPTPQAVEAAAALLLAIHGLANSQLGKLFVSPLPDGGLEIDWELRSGSELMLIAPPEGTDIRYLLDKRVNSGDVVESEGVVPRDATLSELIGRLTAE